MFVTLDTNTLASGALSTEGSPPTLILNAWREGRFTLVVSTDILTELERTLAKPYFASHIPAAETVALKALLLQYAVLAPVSGKVSGVASRKEDDRILEAAVAGKATYLVTGDAQLQRLEAFQGVHILSPRQFQALLPKIENGGGDA